MTLFVINMPILNTRLALTSFVFILFAVLTAHAQGVSAPYYPTETHVFEPNGEPHEHALDIEHLTLNVRFEPNAGKVMGTATHRFKVLREKIDTLIFDAVKLAITAVRVGGKEVSYSVYDSSVVVYLAKPMKWDERDSVSFDYSATPRSGLYFNGWNDTLNLSRKQIWSQGQGINPFTCIHRNWVPIYDYPNDKLITETVVTFDKEYQVLSNGTKLSEKDNGDGTKTWHYTMTRPHAGYLLSIVVGKYAIERRKTKRSVPVNLWYYPEFPERVKPTFYHATECIDFMEEMTGVHYPWESYSQSMVQDFTYGAMENTTVTTFGDFSFVDERGLLDRSYVNTNIHELVHQWFGDYITYKSFKGTWLHESFATFFPKLYTRKHIGEDQYQWMKRGEQNSAHSASDKDHLPIVHALGGTGRFYPKGSSVIDMMWYIWGEDQMRRVLNHYLRHHAYGNVETNDLYVAFQDTLGITPDWFFDQWLYRGGEPHYEVSWKDATISNGADEQRETQVHVRQIQITDELTPPFAMPIVFEVNYIDGTRDTVREWIERKEQVVAIPNSGNKSIAFVLFDPGSNVTKKLTFKKSFEELKAQMLGSRNMIDRYDALYALRTDTSKNFEERYRLLAQVFQRESFPSMRNDCVLQLCNQSSPTARAVMKLALADTSADVRMTALTAWQNVPKELLADCEKLLTDKSYNIISAALDKLCEANPANIKQYLDITKNEIGLYKRVRIKWLEWSAASGDKSAVDSLANYCSHSYEFWARQSAMQSLKKLNACNGTSAMNMLTALVHPNDRLADVAKDVISYFMLQTAGRALFKQVFRSKTWTKEEFAIIDKLVR